MCLRAIAPVRHERERRIDFGVEAEDGVGAVAGEGVVGVAFAVEQVVALVTW